MFWNRFAGSSRPNSDTAEVAAIEEAANRTASDRLGRLVTRQKDIEVESAEKGDASHSSAAEAFANCAFFVLSVPTSATAAEIQHAADDLSFAEETESALLSRAHADLMSPRERLMHELVWLPECDPDFQRRAFAALTARDDQEITILRFAAPGLARINLGCALAVASPRNERLLNSLLDDLVRWEAEATKAAIDAARRSAGFRIAEGDQFASAMADRLAAIADEVAAAACATREGRMALARVIKDHAEQIRGTSNQALEALVAAYGRAVDPKLQALQGKIADAAAALTSNPRQPAVLTTIITTLDLWSQLRLPLQKLEEARGLDDPASAQLFEELRDLGITFANEHQLHGETLRLARALKQAFAAVPGIRPMLERDMPTIMGNVLVDRLGTLTVDAAKKIGRFCAEIRDHGFHAESAGPNVSRLIDCFEQYHEADPTAEVPFLLMRQLMIAVNNKGMAPLLALQMAEWLLDHRVPEKVNAQLIQDMCQLRQQLKNKR